MRYAPVTERLAGLGSEKWTLSIAASARKRAGRAVIDLTIGEPDTPTPEPLVQTAARAMSSGRTGYSNGRGEPSALAALSAHYSAACSRDITADRFLCLPGTQTALFVALMTICDPASEVILGDPMYATSEGLIRASGGVPVPVALRPEKGFRLQAADVAARITPTTRAILVNTPHNPTGVVLDRAEMAAIADVCLTHDLWLMSDEVYWSLVYDRAHTSARSLPGMADRTVVISSLSKSHSMTGWRLGWAVVPPILAEAMENFLLCTIYGLPAFIQDVAPVALAEDDVSAADLCARFQTRRDLVCDLLAGVDGLAARKPEGGMFVMADVRGTGVGSEVFANRLLDRYGVSLLAGEGFGGGADGFVRISLSAPEDRLVEACRRIAAYVAEGAG